MVSALPANICGKHEAQVMDAVNEDQDIYNTESGPN